MRNGKLSCKDPIMRHVGHALRRAAANARTLALETGTALYVYENGRLVNALRGIRRRRNPRRRV